MKLYITPTSPYARVTRIAVIEQGLSDRVEIVPVRTREVASPYYDRVASGRVPTLELDDGRQLEESDLICAYLDSLGAGSALLPPMHDGNWDYGRLHAQARSLVDGLAVWGRETRRDREDQSDIILAHEQARAKRLTGVWEHDCTHPIMQGELCLAQLFLVCGIDSLKRYTGLNLTDGHPNLAAWKQRLDQRPSIIATRAEV